MIIVNNSQTKNFASYNLVKTMRAGILVLGPLLARFNKAIVKKITHLQGEQLDMFLVKYRPDYEFTSNADEFTFNKYILNCSNAFTAWRTLAGIIMLSPTFN